MHASIHAWSHNRFFSGQHNLFVTKNSITSIMKVRETRKRSSVQRSSVQLRTFDGARIHHHHHHQQQQQQHTRHTHSSHQQTRHTHSSHQQTLHHINTAFSVLARRVFRLQKNSITTVVTQLL